MVHEKTFTNKAHSFVWVSCRRYPDFRHILQNPKVPKNVMGSHQRDSKIPAEKRDKKFKKKIQLSHDSHGCVGVESNDK